MTPPDPLKEPIPKRDVVLPPPDLNVRKPDANLELRPISEPPEEGGMVGKVKAIWTVVQKLVEEAVQAAEELYPADGTGPDKKTWVTEKVMTWLRTWERTHNTIPDFVEGMVFSAVEFGLGWIVDRVVRELSERGLVNKGKTT